jgi:hypothetical protein
MLRSIADIARSEGEDLSDPEAALSCVEVFALGGPVRRQPRANARRFSGLPGTDRSLERRGPGARHSEMGHAIVVEGADGCHQETSRKASGEG